MRTRWFACRYSVSTLLLVVTITSLAMGLVARYRRYQRKAAEHHFASLAAGYIAADLQLDTNPDSAFASIKFGELPLRSDLDSIRIAATYWRWSIYHAAMRDEFLQAAGRPWVSVQQRDEPPPIPDVGLNMQPQFVTISDSDVTPEEYSATILPYIRENEYFLLRPGVYNVERDQRIMQLNDVLLTSEQIDALSAVQSTCGTQEDGVDTH